MMWDDIDVEKRVWSIPGERTKNGKPHAVPLTDGTITIAPANRCSIAPALTAAFDIEREPMLYLSAAAWVAAFGGFVIVYAPLLLRRQSR